MSFKDLILPAATVAALYPHSLVADETAPTPATPAITPATEAYIFEGGNARNIVLLTHYPGQQRVPRKQIDFLFKILEACKLSAEDVAVVNQGQQPIELMLLKAQFAPKQVVLFGLEPAQIGLPVNFPHYKIQGFDQVSYLCADTLEQLNQNDAAGKLLKSKLWVSLRELFHLG